jgi:hypothetical protein
MLNSSRANNLTGFDEALYFLVASNLSGLYETE